MQISRNIARCFRPPTLLGESNSMFAGNDAPPFGDLSEQFIEHDIDLFPHRRFAIVTIGHDIHVNVAVPGMTKTGNGKSMARLESFGELDKIDDPTAWHDDVFIQF